MTPERLPVIEQVFHDAREQTPDRARQAFLRRDRETSDIPFG